MKLEKFKSNLQNENAGVWMELGEGARVKLARINSKPYRKELVEKMKPHRVALDNGVLDEEISKRIIAECMANHIIKDWEGFTLNGEPYVYSKQHVIDVLMDETFVDLANLLISLAENKANFDQQVEEADAKK